MEKPIGSRIQSRILRLIEAGEVKAGERLPSERDLAQRFSVSRNTVREAIRALLEKGILVSRRGAGSYVRAGAGDRIRRELGSALARQKLRLTEIFEVRRLLEPAAAAKVARTATDDELSSFSSILDGQAHALENDCDPTPWDLAFHEALIRASGNTVLSEIYTTLAKILEEGRGPGITVPGRAAFSLKSHRRVLKALEAHDPAAASRAMTRHMTEIENMLYQKIEKDLS